MKNSAKSALKKHYQHTSAPWSEQREFDEEAFYVVDNNNCTIAIIPGKEYDDTYIKNTKERFANLSLIKSSPLLLDFIQKVVKELKDGNYTGNHVETMIAEGENLIRKATYDPLKVRL